MPANMIDLGVNIDHVATVRQARKTVEPDPVWAAALAELAGADQITVHLREDRRHVNDRDVEILRKTVRTRFNLEMAVTEPIIKIALKTGPDRVTFVPEKREEITTEGGLDVVKYKKKIKAAIDRFHRKKIEVSLFIDPAPEQIEAACRVGADAVELHTGQYAEASSAREAKKQLQILFSAAEFADDLGMAVYAGHGLTYQNVTPVCAVPEIVELNIGHSIVSRAVFAGMERAVREMKAIMIRTPEIRR